MSYPNPTAEESIFEVADLQHLFFGGPDACNMEEDLWWSNRQPAAGDTSNAVGLGATSMVEQVWSMGVNNAPVVPYQQPVHQHHRVGLGNPTIGAGPEVLLQQQQQQHQQNARNEYGWPEAQVVNATYTIPPPGTYSTGTGVGSCPSTITEMGTGSSPDMEVINAAGASGKRKRIPSCSSSQRPITPEAGRIQFQSDPSCTDIKPPDGSSPTEILVFLRIHNKKFSMNGKSANRIVNSNLAKEDQRAPKAARSYITTVGMMADQMTQEGCWVVKKCVLHGFCNGAGLKRILQFQEHDGTRTNWFMEEYIPAKYWGIDLYFVPLRFRVVYEDKKFSGPGDHTSPEVKINNKIAPAKKHRMRRPEDMVIEGVSPAWQQHFFETYDRHPELKRSNPTVVKGESEAWKHFIKIYDRHPELEGSKVVYAVCCHCDVVLKADTANGTKNLLNHCNNNRTCASVKNKNKNQQPGPSRE